MLDVAWFDTFRLRSVYLAALLGILFCVVFGTCHASDVSLSLLIVYVLSVLFFTAFPAVSYKLKD